MYDRRVVRGNTFAALVIPVSKYKQQAYLIRYATRPGDRPQATNAANCQKESAPVDEATAVGASLPAARTRPQAGYVPVLWQLRAPAIAEPQAFGLG